MSNELATILQNSPEILQTGLDEDTLAVAGGVNNGTKRISIRGKAFRKVVGGKEVATIEDNHMNVIIVKMAHTASRMFYSATYKEGVNSPPVCWSSDSRVPDAEVKIPQSKSCDSCQFNAIGSGQGGVGKACKLSWRAAVVLPNDPAGDIMQLVLPATSAFGDEENGSFPFRPYVIYLANRNVSAGRVITKMKFDPKSSTPKVLFSPVAAVPADDMPIVVRQGKSAIAEQLVKLTVHQPVDDKEQFEKPPVVQAQATPAPQVTPAPSVAQPQSDVAVEEPIVRNDAPAQAKPNNVSDILNKWASKT